MTKTLIPVSSIFNGAIFFLAVLLLVACELEKDNQATAEKLPELKLPASQAGEIVQKAIDWAGGWDNWVTKNTLSYTKIVQYYDSTGTLEKEVQQNHNYQLWPQMKVNISWEENGDEWTIIYNGEEAWKEKNGKKLKEQTDINHAWNSSFGSHYVMCMPFKLADPGTLLEYEGLDTLADGNVVHAIKTTYQEGAGSAAGLHTWRYYFDAEDHSPVANYLDYQNGYSYTQYEAFQDIDGVKVNKMRKSYQTNADRDLIFLRTVYTNKNIQLNANLDHGLFATSD